MSRLHLFLALSLLTSLAACGDDDDATDAAADVAIEDVIARDNESPDVTDDVGTASDTGSTDAPTVDAGGGAECVTDADCMLINDCCTCAAAPLGEDAPACAVDCIQSLCSAAGIEEFTCKAGVCALSNVDCDATSVLCELAPPTCETGMTPHVSGDCYTGLCVPVEACRTVASCDSCAEGQTCVTFETQLGPQYNCAPTPASCGATPDCACLGDEICEDPYICSPGDSLMCVCPVC